ncbi:MAG: DUF255 domain-containing protein [Cyclobacteriaceae bacterium]|nr:DUF255 domain-containing protein [Cyclobacteriaceae bacterium]
MWLRLVVVVLTSVGATTSFAVDGDGDSGIVFYAGNWEEALALAQQENKLIFLNISASWCGPCKLLKNKTFPDTEVGNPPYISNIYFQS